MEVMGTVRPAEQVARRPVERAAGAWVQVLVGPAEGAPNFVLRKFTLEPGGVIPLHRHPTVEHEQYVLSGRIRLTLGDQVEEVAAGDVVFIPSGVAHRYENPGPEAAEFLCVVPQTASYETEWLE
ncbi:MAG: cupin domain-containing protein [bacterium]